MNLAGPDIRRRKKERRRFAVPELVKVDAAFQDVAQRIDVEGIEVIG